MKFFFQV